MISAGNSSDLIAEPAASHFQDSRTCADWLVPLVVFAVAILLASAAYQGFLASAEHLWQGGGHDRNGHYRLGQSMALHLREGQILGWLSDVHSARVWPPLHGILLGFVLAIGGIDYHLGVLPSLGSWVAACMFTFLIARRLTPHGGNFAGLVAVLFFLASPAHRAFATDIMLESLGAGLTLASLYYYVCAVQDRSKTAGCCLGLALTGLLLTKYNYWTLVVAGLGLATLASHWRAISSWVAGALKEFQWRQWLIVQLGNPLTYPLVLSALVTAAVIVSVRVMHGPFEIQLGTWQLQIHTTQTVVYITYLLFLLRVLPWWWKSGHVKLQKLDAPIRQIVEWHGYAIGLWFLWPQRLGYFIWYVTFNNHGRAADSWGWMGNANYYWTCLIEDYHHGTAGLIVALVLCGLGFAFKRRLHPGAGGVLVFLMIAGLLTNYHSANRSRFLHPWIAATWVAAGAGAAIVLFGNVQPYFSRWRTGVACVALAALSLLLVPGAFEQGHAQESSHDVNRPSLLEIADAFLPELAGAEQPTLVANSLIQPFFEWTFAERFGQRRVVANLDWPKSAESHDAFQTWLRTTPSDTLVFLEMSNQSRFDPLWPQQAPGWVRERLSSQDVFVPVGQRVFLQYDGLVVSIWKRKHGPAISMSQR